MRSLQYHAKDLAEELRFVAERRLQWFRSVLTGDRYVTPPLDPNELAQEARLREEEARRSLEADGCPPCYPPSLTVPVRSAPGKYRDIVHHWLSSEGHGGVILCAQLQDWRQFRVSQKENRRKPFGTFVDQAGKRMRRHDIPLSVTLRLDPEQQNITENWAEFHHYHLERLEYLEDKRDEWKEKRSEIGLSSGHSQERRMLDGDARFDLALNLAEHDIERQKCLLRWITQQQHEMGSGSQMPVRAVHRRRKRDNSRQIGKQTRPTRPRKTRSTSRLQQPTTSSCLIQTRSGRISKPPVRYIP